MPGLGDEPADLRAIRQTRQPGFDAVEILRDLRQRDTVAPAADERQPAHAGTSREVHAVGRVEHPLQVQRRPERGFAPDLHTAEWKRGDADDREALAVERERACIEAAGRPPEPAPQALAHHHHRGAGSIFVSGIQPAPEPHPDAEHREVIAGHELASNGFRRVGECGRRLRGRVRHQIRQAVLRAADVDEILIREVVIDAGIPLLEHQREIAGMLDRQRSQRHGVQQAEDDRRGRHRHHQRDHRDGGDERPPPNHAPAEPEIRPGGMHQRSSAGVDRDVLKVAASNDVRPQRASRLLPVPPARRRPSVLHRARGELFVEIAEHGVPIGVGQRAGDEPLGQARRTGRSHFAPSSGSSPSHMRARYSRERRSAAAPDRFSRKCRRDRPPRSGNGADISDETYPLRCNRSSAVYSAPTAIFRPVRRSIS
jgi:hypothetical protein